jgi:hypothetical protein
MTITIRNTEELRHEYAMLNLLREFLAKKAFENEAPIHDAIADEKHAIRQYYKRRQATDYFQRTIIHDDGIDGYIIKSLLTKVPLTEEEAEVMFREEEFIPKTYGPYDCTGTAFTSWYKLYEKPNGEWWYYHRVAFDV